MELCAASSLARLWQQQGKRDEAHELLAPIYARWFAELDTDSLTDGQMRVLETMDLAVCRLIDGAVHERHGRQEGKPHG